MKKLRQIHLLIGCFVAPMAVFFGISGAWQMFNLHRGLKDGSYHPPRVVASISRLHMNEHFEAPYDRCYAVVDDAEREKCKEEQEAESVRLRFKGRIYSGAMALGAVGIFLNAVTGIGMAVKMKARRSVAIALAALGLLVPTILLVM